MNKSKTQADKLWALAIKNRDNFKCQLSGKDHIKCNSILQAAHLISRSRLSIRYNLRNGRCLCSAHHTYYTFRQHEWFNIVNRLWKEDYLLLLQQKNIIQNQFDYAKQIEYFKILIQGMDTA